MNDYITTYTKLHFTFRNIQPEMIRPEDIAHSLSMQCRANGHFKEFYSVSQHCVDCYEEAKARGYHPRAAFACLLHDAGEAYITDLPRPIKNHLPMYIKMEDEILTAIYCKFLGSDLSQEEQELVGSVDDTMFYYEFLRFMGEITADAPPEKYSEPQFRVISHKQAEQEYLKAFREAQKCYEASCKGTIL